MRAFRLSLALCAVVAVFGVTLAAPPSIGGCQIFPSNNAWNTPVDTAEVHPNSANYIANINANGGDYVHPDFGEDPSYGIPWTTVTSSQPLVPISFYYPDESDPGPYPIPSNAPVESGSDHHVLIVETTNCVLYEVYDAEYTGSDTTGWEAGSGAVWPLGSNDLRPDGWTSADAAGLPILPGLARCDEAESGTIDHALRVTFSETQRAYIYPATHFASSETGANYPPMGLRLRLKASYDISHLDGQALAIAQALKKYGMIVADNGSNWFISGETNPGCWDDYDLNRLKDIPGTAFEVVVSPPPPSDVPGDLLKNGGFEAASPNGKTPAYWTRDAQKDKQVCNTEDALGPDVIVAQAGNCAYRFKGNGTNDKLKQTIKLSPALAGGVTVSAYIKTEANPAGSGKIKAKLIGTGGETETLSLDFPSGRLDWAPYSDGQDPGFAIAKVKVKVKTTAGSGFVWLDTVSVVAGASRLPVPAAP